jgi:hypothetical protein
MELMQRGVRRVVFYGAGEVMELAALAAGSLGLSVAAVVDDDTGKQGTVRYGLSVLDPAASGTYHGQLRQVRPGEDGGAITIVISDRIDICGQLRARMF